MSLTVLRFEFPRVLARTTYRKDSIPSAGGQFRVKSLRFVAFCTKSGHVPKSAISNPKGEAYLKFWYSIKIRRTSMRT